MYLLDTNVVSELRRQKPHAAVVAWLESVADEDLFLSAVTLAEIQAGIELTRDQNPQRADELEDWLNSVTDTYNVLPNGWNSVSYLDKTHVQAIRYTL